MVLCSDAHIARLNGEWRSKLEATDVLSFPMEQDSGDGCPVRMLGDLVISLDTAQRQAEERGWVPRPIEPSCALVAGQSPQTASLVRSIFSECDRVCTCCGRLIWALCAGCVMGRLPRSAARELPRKGGKGTVEFGEEQG